MRFLPCLASLVICAWPRAGAARAFSWAEVRTIAERSAPELQLTAARQAIAGAEVQVAGTIANPTLGVSTARETARLSVAVSQPLTLFGQRGTQVRAAQADAATATWESEVVRVDTRHDVSLAWIDLWEAEQRARLLKAAATDANRLRDIAGERFASGSSPRLDAVRATADATRAAAEAQAAALAVDADGARLAYFLGNPAEPSRTAGDPPVPASLPPPDDLAAVPGATHPLLARDAAALQAAQAHLVAERRARWPVVSGDLSVSLGDPTLGATDVIAGVGLELPVLNLRGGVIARVRAQVTLAQVTRDVDAARLGAELRGAQARFAAASLRSRILRQDVLPTLEEARRMTEESYREGRTDFVRVLEAERALIETRLAVAEATSATARAFSDVEHALGHRLDLPAEPPEPRGQ